MPVDALNALVKGVVNHDAIALEASETGDLDVEIEVRLAYESIENELFSRYGLSAADAVQLYAIEDRLLYTMRLQQIAGVR